MTAPLPAPLPWRTLVLIYPVLDARFGSGLARRRARRVMARDEREAIHAILERLPETVMDWSSGLATLEPFDIIEIRRPMGSMSSSGGGRWWVGPREVRPALADVAAEGGRYDSVFALWPGDPDVPQCGWGCTLGPSDETFGAGFSSISTDHWRTLATDPDPEQGYVHEWLHQVEAVYRSLGVSEAELPSLHEAGAFTSRRPVGRAAVRWHVRRVPQRSRRPGRLGDMVAVVSGLDDRDAGTGRRGACFRRLASPDRPHPGALGPQVPLTGRRSEPVRSDKRPVSASGHPRVMSSRERAIDIGSARAREIARPPPARARDGAARTGTYGETVGR